jgi:hypothetical protein
MGWTKEKPITPGWYWCRQAVGSQKWSSRIVFVSMERGMDNSIHNPPGIREGRGLIDQADGYHYWDEPLEPPQEELPKLATKSGLGLLEAGNGLLEFIVRSKVVVRDVLDRSSEQEEAILEFISLLDGPAWRKACKDWVEAIAEGYPSAERLE